MAALLALVFVFLSLPTSSVDAYSYGNETTVYTGSSSRLWSSVCQLWPGLIQKYTTSQSLHHTVKRTTSRSLHHAVKHHIDYTALKLPDALEPTIQIFLEVENLSPDAVMISNAITKIVLRRLLEQRKYCITATLNQFIIDVITNLFNHYLTKADYSLYNKIKGVFITAAHPKDESEELATRIVDRVHRATYRDILYYFETVELGGLLQAVEDFRLDLYNVIYGQELSASAAPQVNVLLPIVMQKVRALLQMKEADCFSNKELKDAYLFYLAQTSNSVKKGQFIIDITLFLRNVHGISLSEQSIQSVIQILHAYIDSATQATVYFHDQLRTGFLTCRPPDLFTVEQVYYINVLFYRLGWLAIPKPPPALSHSPTSSLADTYTRLIDEIIAQREAVDSFTCYLKDKPKVEHAYHVESIEFLQFLSSRVNDSLNAHLIPRKKIT